MINIFAGFGIYVFSVLIVALFNCWLMQLFDGDGVGILTVRIALESIMVSYILMQEFL